MTRVGGTCILKAQNIFSKYSKIKQKSIGVMQKRENFRLRRAGFFTSGIKLSVFTEIKFLPIQAGGDPEHETLYHLPNCKISN